MTKTRRHGFPRHPAPAGLPVHRLAHCGGIIPTILCACLFTGCATPPHPQADTARYLEASRNLRHSPVVWQPAQRFSFDRPSALEAFKIVYGDWEIADGRLRAVSGEGNRAILLTPSIAQPLQITFDATLERRPDGRSGDITVLINASADSRYFGSGYALTTGSFWNNCTTFYRLNRPIARTEHTPVRLNKPNRVRLEFVNGHIRYWLNERIILEAWDDAPLDMDPSLWIGIRTWGTNMQIENLSIRHGTNAPATSALPGQSRPNLRSSSRNEVKTMVGRPRGQV